MSTIHHTRTALLTLALLTTLVPSTSAAAKPLYITVNRAFAPAESPTIDVAFTAKDPVELRVLKPKDLEKYLKGQENLRRSWERPDTLENPGRALSRGFNGMKMPGTFLLYSLNPEMRKALGSTLAERPDDDTTVHTTVAEGPQKLVGVPGDMEVVRRQWLNLDLGGDPRAFDVPGFEGWSSTSSGYEERRVSLKPLPAGVYVLQLVQGAVEGQVVLTVTDLTVQVKQTDGQVLVRVADTAQAPVKGANVTVRRVGAGPLTATTNAAGEAFVDVDDPKLLITAQRTVGAVIDTAIVDTEFFSTLAASPDVFLYTDRPIYRPGDEVKFRGIVRRPDGFLARLFAPANREVTVQLVGTGAGSSSTATTIMVDALGSFSGTLQAPDDAPEGVYRVTATLDGAPHVGEVRVQAYVKPTFFIEMTPGQESVAPGGVITATLKAERYAGGAPLGTAYEVTLTRSALESPTWVDDAGLGGQGSAVTYGSASTTEGKLSVPDRLYSSLAERLEKGEADYADTWASAPKFNDDGTASIEVKVPALKPGEERNPYKYTLTVRARDDQGTFAAATAPFFLSPVDVMGAIRLSTKVSKQAGSTSPTVTIRSTTLSGKPSPQTAGSVTFVVRTAKGDEQELSSATFVTDADGKHTIAVPTAAVGAVFARVTLKDHKAAEWHGEERLLVVGDKGEAVEWVPELSLTTLSTTVSPGDTAQIVALLPEEWGVGGKDKGPLWVTLSGTGIFQTKLISAEGRTVIIPVSVEKRFGSAVYVSVAYPTRSGRWSERTVPLRIIPAERVLTVQSTAARAEAEPLGEQTIRLRVTDHKGRGVVSQVSVSVVDKAVYAVQPEFRPRALDFFYPLVRNNVADFFSAEFQGYGYGHQLARRLGDDGVRFATVKPPKKKTDERDTAYWNGSVITDDTGFAEVTFRMPSNQTLWTITAVAADSSGRVGEGSSQFASRGKATVYVSSPPFLRAGDTATASVRVARGVSSDFKGSVDVALDTGGGSGLTASVPTSASINLGAASEGIVPITLKADAVGAGSMAISVKGGALAMLDRRTIDIEDAAVVDDLAVSRVGGGTLTLPSATGGIYTDVELVLQGSLADAALADVRSLLVYPWGCLEQLVATTAPPLALVAALENTKRFGDLDADSQLLLAEARSRAQHGVQRILNHARPTGGFSWFVDAPPSVEMTLLGLSGIGTAQQVGLLRGREPRVQSSLAWLETQGGLSPFLDAWRALVLAQHDPVRAASRVRAAVVAAAAAAAGTADGDVVAGALAVLAAEAAGLLQEPGTADGVKALAQQARLTFMSGKLPPDADESWRFPLHGVGRLALLGHAASVDGGDVAALKRRFLELFATEGLSTLDRATLVQHSLWLIARDVAATVAMTPPSLTGVDGVTFAPRGTGLVARLKDGTATVTVGSFDGTATFAAKRKTPATTAPAIADGFSLERRYWSVGSGSKTPLAPGAAVAQGDVIWVQLVMDLRGSPRDRSAYAVVEDFIPAGFSPLREDKEYRAEPLSLALMPDQVRQRTFSPRSVQFFVEEQAWWMGSPRELGYLMRADFAGTFIAPPARVEDMYQGAARARTPAQTLVVMPSVNAK